MVLKCGIKKWLATKVEFRDFLLCLHLEMLDYAFLLKIQFTQNIILGAHIVIEDKIAKIAMSQKVLGQYFGKKIGKRKWSSAMFSRMLGTFGTVDPDISQQKDSCGRLFLISCIFFLKDRFCPTLCSLPGSNFWS